MAPAPSGIRVVVRVRPPLGACELAEAGAPGAAAAGGDRKTVSVRTANGERQFRFDCALDDAANQADVAEATDAERMVQSVVDGYHATIFCYGQTGSGKTFTMEGARGAVDQLADTEDGAPIDNTLLGIMPRAVLRLFALLKEAEAARPGERFEVVIDYVQIYRERCYDLLASAGGGAGATAGGRTAVGSSGAAPRPMSARDATNSALSSGVPAISTVGGSADLRMRWRRGAEFYLEGLTQTQCVDAAAAVRLMRLGARNKVMAEHRRNANSSRSHCLFTCHVTRRTPDADVASVAKLTLVDLAGSERSSHTGSGGDALLHSEGVAINQSLLALRKVITMLADQARSKPTGKRGGAASAHVPYRDSRLTSLLKQSLGGNAYACMVACLSPGVTYAEENASTLEYAARAMLVTNAPVINEDPKARLIRELRAEVARLKAELARLQLVGVGAADGEGSIGASKEETAVAALVADAKKAVLGSAAAPAPAPAPTAAPSAPAMVPVAPPAPPAVVQPDPAAARALEELGEKLVHSVRVIKELGDSNGRLRAEMTPLAERMEALETAHEAALDENAQLREKLAVCEMVLEGTFHAAQASGGEGGAAAAAAAAAGARLEQETVKELLNLRRENEALKERMADMQAAAAAAAARRPAPGRASAAPAQSARAFSARRSLRAAQTAAMTAAELKSLLNTPASAVAPRGGAAARAAPRAPAAGAPAPPAPPPMSAMRVTTSGSLLPHATLAHRPATAGGVRPSTAGALPDASGGGDGGDAAATLARLVQARSRLRGGGGGGAGS